MISGYNTGGQPVKVSISYFSYNPFTDIISTFSHQKLIELTRKSITLYGFVFIYLIPKYGAQFYEEMTAKVVSGEIKHRQQVYDGLTDSCEALVAMLKGLNSAKVVVHVADE
jgi:NADPH-dependent curcumin reductase CurA